MGVGRRRRLLTQQHRTDDFSLVGLAALVRDALVLATRESVVLYAEFVQGGFDEPPSEVYLAS
jgi:hypothetical protein